MWLYGLMIAAMLTLAFFDVAPWFASAQGTWDDLAVEVNIPEEVASEEVAAEEVVDEDTVAEEIASEEVTDEVVEEPTPVETTPTVSENIFCHRPWTNTEQTIKITDETIQSHLDHWDFEGDCNSEVAEEEVVEEEVVIEEVVKEEVVIEEVVKEEVVIEEVAEEEVVEEEVVEEEVVEEEELTPPPVSDDPQGLVVYENKDFITSYTSDHLNGTADIPEFSKEAAEELTNEDVIDEYVVDGWRIHVKTTIEWVFMTIKQHWK